MPVRLSAAISALRGVTLIKRRCWSVPPAQPGLSATKVLLCARSVNQAPRPQIWQPNAYRVYLADTMTISTLAPPARSAKLILSKNSTAQPSVPSVLMRNHWLPVGRLSAPHNRLQEQALELKRLEKSTTFEHYFERLKEFAIFQFFNKLAFQSFVSRCLHPRRGHID